MATNTDTEETEGAEATEENKNEQDDSAKTFDDLRKDVFEANKDSYRTMGTM